ncbi:amidohydrolase family protein [Salinicola avicenniae]|uniref:amidohydrolase family protein n=1 Tax=Salinicola avicenniae TaxID=2916836 RepID=UPI0020743514|nr:MULTISPECIES: amidohydrolase family protein [unclassified Salinicola]
MSHSYDVLLRHGTLVDPENGVHGVRDVAIREGRVVEVAPTIAGTAAREHDLAGRVVMPGIVDMHVHLSPFLGGGCGHRMLALAGVTTALDMAGPIEGVVDLAARHGCGLSVACVNYLRPGHTIDSDNPSQHAIDRALTHALGQGAIGLKLLGGHYPLTAESTARAIATAASRGAYVAFHAGTQSAGSNIEGMREACELSAGHPLHLAHINSYCRGQIHDAVQEGEEALSLLAAHPHIRSESYLAPFNGVSGECIEGVPGSRLAIFGLERGGFSPTRAGMREAIEAGWALVNVERDGVIELIGGREGVAAWQARDSQIGISFRANPPEPRLRLVTATRDDGRYAVDALATDGGGIPRNDIVARGLALVHLDALSLEGFVRKASLHPARILGLSNKGHLGIGADADITVLDLERRRPILSYAHGACVLDGDSVVGDGGRMVTTPAGEACIRDAGLEAIVVEPDTLLASPQ